MAADMNPDSDTGAQLRSLYLPDGGVRSVFSSKVADYVASRPDYPSALFDTLAVICGLGAGATVADVGAGTGLLTRGLLQRGYRVIAVEPNREMRAAADHLLNGIEGYRSLDGSAEAMPLESDSIDLVTVALAFHWFDVERARAEFLRILTPQGQVAIIWNDRVFEDPLHVAFDELADKFGGAKRAAIVAHEKDRADVSRFLGNTQLQEFCWPHAHRLGENEFLALVFSRSYIPERGTQKGQDVADRAREIFDRFATNGAVEIRYQTIAIVGRPR